MRLTLFCNSLCLILFSDTMMLNRSLCLNRSGASATKWSKDFCPSELTPLEISGDRSIGDGYSLPIFTTDWAMSVPSTGPAFQAYNEDNTPCNHWRRLPLSAEFILYILFKYLQNPSFIIAVWFPLETECTRISKVSWKLFLDIPGKIPSASTTIIFGSPNGTKKFPKYYFAAWSDVISFSPIAAPSPNPVIQSRHGRILRDPSQYGMYPGSQKSINTMSNGVSDSIVISNCCASWEHELKHWQCAYALINWNTYLLTIGPQNHASTLNKVLCSWLFPSNVDMCPAYITTSLNLEGTTLSLSCITLAVRGVS